MRRESVVCNVGREGKGEGFKKKQGIYSRGRAVRMKPRKGSSSSRLPGRPLSEQPPQRGVGVKGRVFGRKWGQWVRAICVCWSRGG